MENLKRRAPNPDDVILELQAVGSGIFAAVRVPGRRSDRIRLDHLPIHRAATIAMNLAERLGVQVAVVDEFGLWPE